MDLARGHALRNEVEVGGAVAENVRRVIRHEPPFVLETGVERRLLDGGQDAARREGDARLLQELVLRLENPGVVAIEADDHPGDDHEVVRLDLPDALDERLVDVLPLLRLLERIEVRRLDAHENAGEVRLA